MRHPLHPAGDRIYRAIKLQLLAGEILPGDRIDAVGLAQALGASLTPVRAALHRLVGERLIESRLNEGFHTRTATESGLRSLYDWNERVAQMALRLVAGADEAAMRVRATAHAEANQSEDPIPSIDELLEIIGRRSRNEACLQTIQGLNDQLHAARRAEAFLIDDHAGELADLAKAWSLGDLSRLARRLRTYHARRLRLVPDLIRLLHRARD